MVLPLAGSLSAKTSRLSPAYTTKGAALAKEDMAVKDYFYLVFKSWLPRFAAYLPKVAQDEGMTFVGQGLTPSSRS